MPQNVEALKRPGHMQIKPYTLGVLRSPGIAEALDLAHAQMLFFSAEQLLGTEP